MVGVELYVVITAVLAISGVVMGGLTVYHMSAAGKPWHIRDPKRPASIREKFSKQAVFNSALSFATIYGAAFLFGPLTLHAGEASWLEMVGDVVLVIVLYDFLYYLMHRYPFHKWGMLKQVHAVHHTVKHPRALDSLYLHPVENFLGIALLWISILIVTAVVGPMNVYAFGVLFLLYSLINIMVHMGLTFRGPLKVFSYLGERHYKHHASMKAGNYANLIPIYDWVFGTEEP